MADETIVGGAAAATETNTTTPDTGAQAAPASVSGAQEGSEGTATTATTAVAAPAASAAPGTIADGTGEPPADIKPDWPSDWRQKLAGEDKAYLKTLERFGSPADLAAAYRGAQQKLSAGGAKPAALPENATPEQLAAWRTENGIPESADKYEIPTPEGFVWGEADKPLLDSIKAHAHGKNWTPTQLNEAVEWYTTQQAELVSRQVEADGASKDEGIAELAREWGNEYKPNLNAVSNLLKTLPEGVGDRLLSARGPDGKLLGNDPGMLKALAGLAREINPTATLLPPGAQNGVQGIEARISEIKAIRTGPDADKAYWKNPALQAEYRDLIAARDKMAARAA